MLRADQVVLVTVRGIVGWTFDSKGSRRVESISVLLLVRLACGLYMVSRSLNLLPGVVGRAACRVNMTGTGVAEKVNLPYAAWVRRYIIAAGRRSLKRSQGNLYFQEKY